MSFTVNWLPETAYIFLLIFARVGTMLMLLPALGEQVIPARIRLAFALVFALVLFRYRVGFPSRRSAVISIWRLRCWATRSPSG